jgi:predicted phosphodiesterase
VQAEDAKMTTIKFIAFNDIHISSINPESRLGNYKKDILDKLEQIKLVGAKLKVDFFVFAGDLFNLKAPLKNPHDLNTELIDLFKSFPAPIYATEGNHDLRNDSYETFKEQPLSVIYASGALVQARNKIFKKDDFKINIRSFPFNEDPELSTFPKAEKSDLNICLLHLYSIPEGGNLFKQKLYSYKEIGTLGDNIFVLGHYHINQGIQSLGEQMFVNVGAISRGTFSYDNIDREPKIALITATKEGDAINYTGQTVRLKVKPATEVFDFEQREEDKKKVEEAETFVAKLKDDMITVEGDKDRIEDEVSLMKLEKRIMDKTHYFLNKADIYIKENK